MSLVPGCVVTVVDPVQVVLVILFLPKEVLFFTPIMPPFIEPAGCAI